MMKNQKNLGKGEIIIYKSRDSKGFLEVKLREETVWLSQKQIALLFQAERSVITKHVRNIFKSKELNENSVCAFFAHTAGDGKIYRTKFYNLDVIISVGYRVNSKNATQFRIWATKVLKDHIVKGFTINRKRLGEKDYKQVNELEGAVLLLQKTINKRLLTQGEAVGLLNIITGYAKSWILLQKYDEGKLKIGKTSKTKKELNYNEAEKAILELKNNLLKKNEAGNLFGNEREKMLDGILGNIRQSFAGKELYPSIEEKAAHLLYFVIKDHPFSDGNKRIGAFLFLLFLAKNDYLINKYGQKKFDENGLVALALLIAESDPKEKEAMVKLVINLLK